MARPKGTVAAKPTQNTPQLKKNAGNVRNGGYKHVAQKPSPNKPKDVGRKHDQPRDVVAERYTDVFKAPYKDMVGVKVFNDIVRQPISDPMCQPITDVLKQKISSPNARNEPTRVNKGHRDKQIAQKWRSNMKNKHQEEKKPTASRRTMAGVTSNAIRHQRNVLHIQDV
ncbi:uncharacterized protein LOC128206989 [Mya arenaria]|uniref:uncharacterized protein LOC128206989 n=1 Tax=Mya arenaria TaxID=6604 RepID=UPI0022E18D56|nr:uncharacterized protein LOC128206989 [Mya arenaria]